MYKIPDVPSSKADIHEIADFTEIECIKKKTVSAREVFSSIDKYDDHYYAGGVPEDEALEPRLADAINEIDRRCLFCGGRYPFTVGSVGHVVKLNPAVDEAVREVYAFLLFATRLDMKNHREQNGIDGALLFEELSEYIGKHYFGERTESFLFGTASRENNFQNKIISLTKLMGEGRSFESRIDTSPNSNKDDGLDVVVWKPFSDFYPGKLIGFGQCKTGTHWKDNLTFLRPDSFCKKWFKDQPPADPVRLFFISESILRNQWYDLSAEGGILFDRCRIMDYLPVNEIRKDAPPFLSQIKAWNKTVVEIELKSSP
ncbi:MAG: hypothetical protein QG657_1733 [Acidobacteriota bacterium]|nr:hypothetical protein [Acidobacteriota bacterium]